MSVIRDGQDHQLLVILSLANACGVFKAFIDGEMWSFET